MSRGRTGCELYGRREGEVWSLGLVPRDSGVRRAIGSILVSGEDDAVRRIELRRSAKQHIDMATAPPRRPARAVQHTSDPKSMKSAFRPPGTPLQMTLTASWEWSDSRCEQAIWKSRMRLSASNSR